MTLTNVVLTDALTDDETYVSGDGPVVGDLEVDETWTYSASYTVTQADIDAGGNFDTTDPADGLNDVIRNVASVDTDQTDPEEDHADSPVDQSPDLAIVKTVTAINGEPTDTTVNAAGDVISYSITVENTGNVTLTNVVLTDALTDDETYVSGDGPVVGDLKVDETWTYSASYTVTQADIDAGGNFDTTDPADGLNDVIRNVASVDTDQTDPEEDHADSPVDQSPDLAIVKTVTAINGEPTDTTVNAAGDVISYSITVENTGNVTLTNVVLTDALTDDETYVSGDGPVVGDLEVDETWTYSASYTVTQADIDAGGNFDTTDPARRPQRRHPQRGQRRHRPDRPRGGPTPTRRSTRMPRPGHRQDGHEPSTVSTTDTTVDEAGDVISYTITVENTGNRRRTASMVTRTRHVTRRRRRRTSTSPTRPTSSTPTPTQDPPPSPPPPPPPGDLEVDETWTFSAGYTVPQSDIDTNFGGDGHIDNTATARHRPDPTPKRTRHLAGRPGADLAIVKSVTCTRGQ